MLHQRRLALAESRAERRAIWMTGRGRRAMADVCVCTEMGVTPTSLRCFPERGDKQFCYADGAQAKLPIPRRERAL